MQSREVPFSEFVKNVTGGEIRAVTLDGEKVRFTGPDKREQFTIRPGDADVTNLLIANDVAIRAEQQETSGIQSFLMTVFPFLYFTLVDFESNSERSFILFSINFFKSKFSGVLYKLLLNLIYNLIY